MPRPCWILALCLACGGAPAPRRAHVVVVSLDTVRRDHLGCYGATLPTPVLDDFAASATRFEAAWTAAPTTLAAHASLFTGNYPHTHGVPRNGFVLDAAQTTLAERLAAEGYHCAGFAGSFALDERFALDQGFAHWDQEFGLQVVPGVYDQDQRRAAEVTAACLDHLDRRGGDEPLFLFVHYFDAHAPFEPPPADLARAGAGEQALVRATLDVLSAAIGVHWRRWTGKERTLDEVVLGGLTREALLAADGRRSARDEEIARLYAAEVLALDRELGTLFAGLERRGILEEAIVVVLADHGESFCEHADVWNHGLACYGSTVDVPLLVRLPGQEDGRVIATPVSTIDVAPTICSLLGIQPAESASFEGVDLAAALRGAEAPTRPIFCEATQPYAGERGQRESWLNRAKTRSVRAGRYKFIATPYLGHEELYDLSADPQERTNLLLAPSAADAAAAADLRARLAEWSRGVPARQPQFEPTLAEETRERLRALGYGGDD